MWPKINFYGQSEHPILQAKCAKFSTWVSRAFFCHFRALDVCVYRCCFSKIRYILTEIHMNNTSRNDINVIYNEELVIILNKNRLQLLSSCLVSNLLIFQDGGGRVHDLDTRKKQPTFGSYFSVYSHEWHHITYGTHL